MSSIYEFHARRLAGLSVAVLASTLALAACDDDSPTDPVTPVEWEAQLAGVGEFEDVEGLAAVSSTATSFDAAIEIAGAEEDAVFTWRVAEGTCAQPGDRIGAADRYPDLEVEADGTASAEADVTAALDEEEDYIVSVLDETGEAAVTVACGALEIGE
ncbi:MAG TPA: hypothetical protein VHG09_07790 [Longimicrobiales bacterium]|nr:hypothetical protein [Longimicrobiales bacterium]